MRLKERNRAWFMSEPIWLIVYKSYESSNNFFTSGVIGLVFLRLTEKVRLYQNPLKRWCRCAYSILEKWLKSPQMTSRPSKSWLNHGKNTGNSFNFLKFSVFIELERKNLFNGNIASHRLWVRDQLKLSTDLWKSIKYLESRQLEKSDIIRDNRWNQSYFDIRKFQITSVRIEIFDINRKSFRYFEYSANRRKIAR